MSLRYKMDILEALKEAGYSAYRLRKEKIFGERVVQQLRHTEFRLITVMSVVNS